MRSTLLACAALLASLSAHAMGRHKIIAEYGLSSNPSWAGLTAGPDGNMWVAGYGQIARVSPTGTVMPFANDAFGTCITVGPDGALWFAAVGTTDLGRITTKGKSTYVTIPPPPGSSNIPTILGIVTGPDGNLWMTDYGNAELIRLTPGGTISYIPLGAGAYPDGITNGPDGALWVADKAGRLDRVTTSGVVTTVGLPGSSPSVQSVTLGGDGNLWVDSGSSIDRVTPAGQVTSFPIPMLGTDQGTIQAVSTDSAGNIWFTAWYSYPHEHVGVMDLSGHATLLHALTSGSGDYAIAPGPARTMWFTEVFDNKVGKAK